MRVISKAGRYQVQSEYGAHLGSLFGHMKERLAMSSVGIKISTKFSSQDLFSFLNSP
jgi:hypothetical protein